MTGGTTERPLRIAMIGARYIPVRQGSGGIERHVEELSAQLSSDGHEVTVFVRGPAPDHYRGFGLKTVPALPSRYLDTISRSFAATILAVLGHYDVIHYHGVGPAGLAWLPRLLSPRSKVVVTFHSIDRLHQKWGFLARLYLRFGEWSSIRFPHRTIVVSRNIQKYCDRVYRVETEYIPNGTKISEYPGDDELSRWGLRKNGYILAVSRFVRLKGLHYLIEAFAQLQTGLRLVIVGGGGGDPEYEEFLRFRASGDSCVIFTGFQSPPALWQLYANAYVYVHPSEIEGLAISILEAMSFGQCVLASDIPENREPLHGSGVTFVNMDVDDLAKKLQSLINHPEVVKQRGRRAARWIAAEYGWDRVTKMTEGLYLDLIQGKKSVAERSQEISG